MERPETPGGTLVKKGVIKNAAVIAFKKHEAKSSSGMVRSSGIDLVAGEGVGLHESHRTLEVTRTPIKDSLPKTKHSPKKKNGEPDPEEKSGE